MSNTSPPLKFIFFRNEKWPKKQLLWTAHGGLGGFIPVQVDFNGDLAVGKPMDPPADELLCVGYSTTDASNIASISVFPVGSKSRELCKEIVRGKHAAGKTFEIVTVPHRVAESVVLGAKYFLLTRERS